MASIRKIKLKRGTAHEVVWSEYGVQQRKYYPPEIPYMIVKREAAKIETDKAYKKTGLAEPVAAISLRQLQTMYVSRRRNEVQTEREDRALELLIREIGNIDINRITAETINEYRNTLLDLRTQNEEQKKRRGVNNELRYLRVVFRWAYRKGLMENRIFDKVDFLLASKVNIPVLTRSESRRMFAHLPDNIMRIAFVFFKYQGLRRSEFSRLEKQDVDLVKNELVLKKTKNRTQNAKMPLHPNLIRILKWTKFDTWPDGKIYPYKAESMTKAFRMAMLSAGFRKPSPVHILRHTFVTRIMSKTKNIFLAQKLARHEDYNTTKKYEHLDIEDLREDFNKVNL